MASFPKNTEPIRTLFLDIGGVLLSNGWAHESRYLAVDRFGLDKAEMEERHAQVFPGYEIGNITLEEYLDWTVFYESRAFSKEDFTAFMFAQSKSIAGSVDFFKKLKQQNGLKVFALSNEGRELNEYRIKTFNLDTLFDGYISSCYVHLRKPNVKMLHMACDVSHSDKAHCLYVDDRSFLVDFARAAGIPSIQFKSVEAMKNSVKELPLSLNKN
ncbi:MAG: HAD family hydrolase [Chitinophagaceae bacterium]